MDDLLGTIVAILAESQPVAASIERLADDILLCRIEFENEAVLLSVAKESALAFYERLAPFAGGEAA